MKKHVDLNYSELFSRSLKEMGPLFDVKNKSIELNRKFDRFWDDKSDVGYIHNSYGYRCEEFNNQELMFLGCSHTYGMGSKLEHTWPYLLSKKLGMDYINLARGGDSAQAQIIKAFQFFKEFYKPKYIVAVLPVFRLEFPNVKDILKNNNQMEEQLISQYFFNNSHKDIKKISKTPYVLDDMLPREVPVFYNFMFIQMLIEYCNSNNINLLWTTYDIGENVKDLLNLKNEKQYFYLDYWHKHALDNHTCHSELKNNKNFDIAADNGHLGLHYHIHLAELLHSLMV